jgi:hypothetical protein
VEAVTGVLRVPRRGALAAIAVLVAAASAVSFAESYRGLFDWAREHGLSGPWAVIWPLQVDVFIAVGELALFVALADAWARRSRIGAWAVTLAGLAVSVAGNVGHVHGHSIADRATAAVPPLAAAAALAVGLGVLKRVVGAHHQVYGTTSVQPPVPASEPAPGAVPGPDPGVAALNGHAHAAADLFAADLEAGRVPGIRAIRSGLHVGQDKAGQVQAYLRTLARTQ